METETLRKPCRCDDGERWIIGDCRSLLHDFGGVFINGLELSFEVGSVSREVSVTCTSSVSPFLRQRKS
jgi:hypothetical protein